MTFASFSKIFFTLVLALLIVTPGLALAEEFKPGAQCTGEAASSTYCQNITSDKDPISGDDGILVQVIKLLITVAGAISVIMIIIGGLRFVLSNGEPDKAASARKTVLYAVVGLIVVIVAQSLVSVTLRLVK